MATSDRPVGGTADRVADDARLIVDALEAGGLVIMPTDVAYAFLCHGDDAIGRMYATKQRSFDRKSGLVGGLDLHDRIHVLGGRERAMIRAITREHDLPLAVVAPVDLENPFVARLSPFARGLAIKDGTVNLLINPGPLREAVSALCWERQLPVMASSANASGKGAKYRLGDIEPEVRAAADFSLDYGPAKYANPERLSTTQIDFRTMRLVRRGIMFDSIAEILRSEFRVELGGS